MKNEIRERMVRDPECWQIAGISRPQRDKLESQGLFPKRRRIANTRSTRWLYSELIAWINKQETLR